MQVNAINAQITGSARNFTGKRDNIDAFINLDDGAIQQLAYLKTIQKVDDKKHRKIDRTLMNLVPVAAGVAAAVLTKGKNFTKKGRLENLMTFGATTAKWFAAFGIIDLVFAGKNKLDQKSENSREFTRRNPFISFLATAGLSFAAIAGAKKGAVKLLDKYGARFTEKYDAKINKKLLAAGEKLDNSKILNWVSDKLGFVSKKTPSALKEFGKSVLSWSPAILGLGAVVHSADHAGAKARELNRNYNDLKDKQFELSKRRMTELAVQNDYMLTDPKNREDLALLKAPKKDLNM